MLLKQHCCRTGFALLTQQLEWIISVVQLLRASLKLECDNQSRINEKGCFYWEIGQLRKLINKGRGKVTVC